MTAKHFYWLRWAVAGGLFYLGYFYIAYVPNIQICMGLTFAAGLFCPLFREPQD
jgi:hypothetical protein